MNSGIIQDQFTFSLRVLMEVGNKVQRSDPLMELLQISMVYQHDGAGSVYISSYFSGYWEQHAKLVPIDAVSGDDFGRSVSAFSSSAIIVGAYQSVGDDEGSAYIFTISSTNYWTQGAKLLALDHSSDDYFGFPVAAVSTTVALIGARGNDDGGYYSGSSYVFEWHPPGITVFLPDGSTNYTAGEVLCTTWSSYGLSSLNVMVYLYKGSSLIQILESSHPAIKGRAYSYLDGFILSGNDYRVMVVDADDASMYQFSSYFSIGIKDDPMMSWSEQMKLTALDSTSSDYFGSALG
eukprot:CAMPEP_0117827086 /NCGR_PEP_ID=MMETSP0949-20121206/6494_1 /TAXON_ID=44440 /ORGANISM="Chattonella subsalsa, Strain CCMP2191" /LENGTH=292 /DNA_ID=CAMNT_0005667445 /DNA_START=406 /DNA_END=1281 /DNA_ORIENTATION=-